MPALNVDLDYFDHPKTVRLEQLLGRGAAELPLRLWTYCAKYHRKDGCLTAYTPETLEAALRWRGKAGAAVQALLECGAHIGKRGFLEETGDGYQVHDWEEHQGHLERYHEAAKAGARARWDRHRALQDAIRDADRNADRIADCNPDRNAPSRQGNTESRSRARALGMDQRPALEEVRTEAREQGYRCDPDRWFHVSAAAGWVDAKGRPLRDWKAALAAWERLEAQMPSRNGHRHQPIPEDKEREKQRERERLEYNRKVAAEARAMGRTTTGEELKGAA